MCGCVNVRLLAKCGTTSKVESMNCNWSIGEVTESANAHTHTHRRTLSIYTNEIGLNELSNYK